MAPPGPGVAIPGREPALTAGAGDPPMLVDDRLLFGPGVVEVAHHFGRRPHAPAGGALLQGAAAVREDVPADPATSMACRTVRQDQRIVVVLVREDRALPGVSQELESSL